MRYWSFAYIVNNVIVPEGNKLLLILIGIAMAAFFFGIVRYLFAMSEKATKQGRDVMLWGLIGLFVIMCIGGIIFLIGQNLQLSIGKPATPFENNFPK